MGRVWVPSSIIYTFLGQKNACLHFYLFKNEAKLHIWILFCFFWGGGGRLIIRSIHGWGSRKRSKDSMTF